ncbi:MAG: Uma2 family endonuclease [Gemmatimonadales bacterium]
MPETIRRWTREEVLTLPDDGNRYELIDGELLVSPSPRGLHQRAVVALYDLIGPYVRRLRIGSVGLAPSDLDLRSEQVSQPDLFVVHRQPDGKEPIDWPDYGIPFFIAEVTSPSTARYDRIVKRRRYQRSRVAEYWIIDPDARAVERWRPDDARSEILDETIVWHPSGATEELAIDLPAYFRRVWAEED